MLPLVDLLAFGMAFEADVMNNLLEAGCLSYRYESFLLTFYSFLLGMDFEEGIVHLYMMIDGLE